MENLRREDILLLTSKYPQLLQSHPHIFRDVEDREKFYLDLIYNLLNKNRELHHQANVNYHAFKQKEAELAGLQLRFKDYLVPQPYRHPSAQNIIINYQPKQPVQDLKLPVIQEELESPEKKSKVLPENLKFKLPAETIRSVNVEDETEGNENLPSGVRGSNRGSNRNTDRRRESVKEVGIMTDSPGVDLQQMGIGDGKVTGYGGEAACQVLTWELTKTLSGQTQTEQIFQLKKQTIKSTPRLTPRQSHYETISQQASIQPSRQIISQIYLQMDASGPASSNNIQQIKPSTVNIRSISEVSQTDEEPKLPTFKLDSRRYLNDIQDLRRPQKTYASPLVKSEYFKPSTKEGSMSSLASPSRSNIGGFVVNKQPLIEKLKSENKKILKRMQMITHL